MRQQIEGKVVAAIQEITGYHDVANGEKSLKALLTNEMMVVFDGVRAQIQQLEEENAILKDANNSRYRRANGKN